MKSNFCLKHNLPQLNICGRDECHNLYCNHCLAQHQMMSGHTVAVRLDDKSKSFFLLWNQYLIVKMQEMVNKLQQSEYTQIFDMMLKDTYNFQQFPLVESQQVTDIAIKVLHEEIRTVSNNLSLLKNTKNVYSIINHAFIKQLYLTVTQQVQQSLKNLSKTLQYKLIKSFPTKTIYKHLEFAVQYKYIKIMQAKRLNLLKNMSKTLIQEQLPRVQSVESQDSDLSKLSIIIQDKIKIKNIDKQTLFQKGQNQIQQKFQQKYEQKNTQISLSKNSFDKIQDYQERFKKLLKQEKEAGQFDPVHKKTSSTLSRLLKRGEEQKSPYKLMQKWQQRKLSISQIKEKVNPQQQKYQKHQQIRKQNQIKELKRYISILNNQLNQRIRKIRNLQKQFSEQSRQNMLLNQNVKNLQLQIYKMNQFIQSKHYEYKKDLHQIQCQFQEQMNFYEHKIRQIDSEKQDIQYSISRLRNQNLGLKTSLNEKLLYIQIIKNIFPKENNPLEKENELEYIKRRINQSIQKTIFLERKIQSYNLLQQIDYFEEAKVNQVCKHNQSSLLTQLHKKDALIQLLSQRVGKLNEQIHQISCQSQTSKQQLYGYRRKLQQELSQVINQLNFTKLELKKEKSKNQYLYSYKMSIDYDKNHKSSVELQCRNYQVVTPRFSQFPINQSISSIQMLKQQNPFEFCFRKENKKIEECGFQKNESFQIINKEFDIQQDDVLIKRSKQITNQKCQMIQKEQGRNSTRKVENRLQFLQKFKQKQIYQDIQFQNKVRFLSDRHQII